jgi:hypothetical protein
VFSVMSFSPFAVSLPNNTGHQTTVKNRLAADDSDCSGNSG